jgi:hypothetical protein
MNYYNKIKKAIEELEANQDINIRTEPDKVINYLVKAINSEVKQYMPQQSNKPRETITASVNNIFKNMTSTGKDYLLLKTDKIDPKKDNSDNIAIFCFRLEERWGELNEGGNYTFIVEISERQTYILADFHKNY